MNNVQLNVSGEAWLQDVDLMRLMSHLNQNGDDARIVGGAVRDTLLNIFWKRKRKVGDVDIASKLTPQENIKILEEAGIDVVPTGLKHGTITAIINKQHFEITTLRKDVSTDGRHAEVEFSKDWTEDAKRRDFTINALYLDMDGNIYDPLGGFKDIKAARVCFIGDARTCIRGDALRILRFFRFASDIEVGGVDEKGVLAAVELKEMINTLSGERIRDEFKKIDDQVEDFLDKLWNDKEASATDSNTVIDDIATNLLPEWIFYRQYKSLCNGWILAKRAECTWKVANTVAGERLDQIDANSACMNLVKNKLNIYSQVAYDTMKINKSDVREDRLQEWVVQELRTKYDALMSLMTTIIWHIGRMARWITHWTPDPK